MWDPELNVAPKRPRYLVRFILSFLITCGVVGGLIGVIYLASNYFDEFMIGVVIVLFFILVLIGAELLFRNEI